MSERIHECDVAVIGGGMGGVAAALAAADAGKTVLLSEATEQLSNPPTWGQVCAAFAAPMANAFGIVG